MKMNLQRYRDLIFSFCSKVNINFYCQCLDKIIERDFFPDYEKLKDQNDYLEASSANNFEEMRKIALKYSTKNNKTKNPLQGKNLILYKLF